MPWTLAILCGGESSRLGSDKGLYCPRGEGEPLVLRMLRSLGLFATDRMIVVRDDTQRRAYESVVAASPFPARLVMDQTAEQTPPRAALVGVRTALRAAWGDPVIVVPVDQIGANALHVTTLLACIDREERYGDGLVPGGRRAAAFGDALGRPLPFPSLWERGLEPAISAAIEAEALSVKGALRALGAILVPHPADIPSESLTHSSNTAAEIDALTLG